MGLSSDGCEGFCIQAPGAAEGLIQLIRTCWDVSSRSNSRTEQRHVWRRRSQSANSNTQGCSCRTCMSDKPALQVPGNVTRECLHTEGVLREREQPQELA